MPDNETPDTPDNERPEQAEDQLPDDLDYDESVAGDADPELPGEPPADPDAGAPLAVDMTVNGDDELEIPDGPGIYPIEIDDEMKRSFLDYAMSVIVSRALPDARDGLKPVHRRILFGMEGLNARPDRPRLKCARITGDVVGKYHPHGDGAVYEALVRLAQPFSVRHPLIDFQGNYGSLDDGAAAARYTEARLSNLAMELLNGIDEDTVVFKDNYDGKNREPVVLPARFPNLLVNGSQGIAVGMATNIPPHNLGEVIDATIHLIDNPESTPEDLMTHVKGPDFPTGGQILGRQGILDAYRTGRGSIKMRAKAEIVERKGRYAIEVTELPYQVGPNQVLHRITELVIAKDIDGIADLNDESAGGKTRIVIPLKRDANPQVVLNNLYKLTQLQTSFGVNVVALVGGEGEDPGVPRTLNLVAALRAYVDHQVDVITRRSKFRLKKAEDRAHILDGYLKAINIIDDVIALIRGSENRAAARTGLMATWDFTEVQAEAILELTLGRLTRLARVEIDTELEGLRERIKELKLILDDPERLRQVIKDELTEIKRKYANDRRTEITHDAGEIVDLDLIDDEPLVITMTKAGYIKTVAADQFRSQARGGRGIAGAKLKEEDLVTDVLHSSAHHYVLCFSNLGKVYRLRAHEIPMRERNAKGTPIVNLLPLAPDERIATIIDTRDFNHGRHLFFATKRGHVKKTLLSEYDKSRRDGFIAIKLIEGDELVRVMFTSGDDDVLMVSKRGMTIRFSETDVRSMGRSSQGVRGMNLREGDQVVSCDVARDDVSILIVTDGGYGKRTQLTNFNRQNRGGYGVIGIRFTARKGGGVVAAFMVSLEDEIVLVSSGGVVIRTHVKEVSSQGRDATGVRIMNLDDGQTVASVAPIVREDEVEGANA